MGRSLLFGSIFWELILKNIPLFSSIFLFPFVFFIFLVQTHEPGVVLNIKSIQFTLSLHEII